MEGGAGRVKTRTYRTHHADLHGARETTETTCGVSRRKKFSFGTAPRTYRTDVFLPARARDWGRNESTLLMCARVTDRDPSGASATNITFFPANVTTDHVPPERDMDTGKTS